MSLHLLDGMAVAIRLADHLGTLRVERFWNQRLGTHYWAVSDEAGLIEVYLDEQEARERVDQCTEGAA